MSVIEGGFSCVLLGGESLTIACGDMILAGGHRIEQVVTRDAAVRGWAEAQGIAVCEAAAGLAAPVDYLLSIAHLEIIPGGALALARRGAVNFHDGPLPRYAGLNTPAWAILNGEAAHGVSWHVIEGGVDEGDLLAQAMIEIAADETALSLNSKCYAAGMESFGEVLAQLAGGALQRRAQDLSQRSYFARDARPEAAGQLDFSRDAAALERLARGLDFGDYWNPLGLLKLWTGAQMLAVGSCEQVEGAGQPGEVLAQEPQAVVIAAAQGALRLSGLRGLDGAPVDLAALLPRGAVMPAPLADADVAAAAKAEAQWRRVLAGAQMLPAPMSGGAQRVQRVVPCGDRGEAAVLAAVAAALGGGGVIGAAFAGGPLVADWVPMALGDAEAMAAQLARAKGGAGMAADLLLRDPAIEKAAPQIIWGGQGDAPLNLRFEAASLTLEGRMSEAAAGLLAARVEWALAGGAGLPEAERDLLLGQWNQTSVGYDRSQTIASAFADQAGKTPQATALVFEDQSLSYAALEARANQVAHVLQGMGVAAGAPVGLCIARGVDMMVAALGILKAGGAYVPMDPAYPAERLRHYARDSGAAVIVSHSAQAGDLDDLAGAQVLLLDRDARIAGAPETAPQSGPMPGDMAYLIYTSGSTGTPKGVMVSHGNVMNFFAAMDARIEHAPGQAWLAVTSLSFDISVLELFWTLARGMKLVLAGDDSRTMLSNGPVARAKPIDFNLFYWGNDDGIGPKKYELLLEGAKFADANGFNAVWTPERHFHAFGGPYPNPSVTGAAVAAVTQNLDVRAGSCVAPLHHPARIAEEWAVIDNLTNGRVGLAIASGWQPDDFVLRPENTPPENKPAMYAAIEQLRALWTGEAVEFPTKDGTPFAVVTQPRPVSKTLPIWVTTAGNPQTWKEAGEIGANVLTHLLGQSVDEVADKIKIYHAALRGAGHDPDDFKVTVMLHSYLAATRAEAEAVAREPMKDYLRSAAGLIKQYAWAFPAFKRPEGATNPFQVDLEGLSVEEMDAILEFAFQRYFNDSGLFGTVEDGVARTAQLQAIGVNEIACLIDYGIPVPQVLEGLRPLAEVRAKANAGGELAQGDYSLAAQLVRHEVSHLQCTPSMAQMLVSDDHARAALRGLRQIMVGGEALPGRLAQALAQASGVAVQNMYGPTETTIWSTTHQGAGGDEAIAPIGTPIANTQVYVVDEALEPQPVGVAGELLIGGEGVTMGYWQRDEMTAERFVANPFGAGKLYRTGDLVAWQADGTLAFAGRLDAQVKIRGHRIELGEVEAALSGLEGIRDAVVVAKPGAGGPQLVGYVLGTGDEDALRAQLAAQLPQIMVPARIVTLAAFPLTPNKKIDRKALPDPAPKQQAQAEQSAAQAAAPQSDMQKTIAGVWSGILGVAQIRAGDSFFALGGHSLLAVQAHRELRAALGTQSLSITDIFRFPTLEGLARHLEGGSAADAPAAPSLAPQEKDDLMSKRRAMRARRSKAGA